MEKLKIKPLKILQDQEWQRKAVGLPEKRYEKEDELQADCVAWFRHYFRKEYVLFSVPNGGTRHQLEAMVLLHTGLMKGASDLILLVPDGKCHFIEMKLGKDYIDPNQVLFKEKVERLGFTYNMAKSFQQFRHLIQHLLEIPDELFNTYI